MWQWCDSAWTQYLSGIKSLFFISEMLTDLRTDRHEEDNSAPKGNKIIRLVPLHIYDESQDRTYNKQMQLTILFLHFHLEWIKWKSLVHLMVFDNKSSTFQWLTHLPPHSSDSNTHYHIQVTHTLSTTLQYLIHFHLMVFNDKSSLESPKYSFQTFSWLKKQRKLHSLVVSTFFRLTDLAKSDLPGLAEIPIILLS